MVSQLTIVNHRNWKYLRQLLQVSVVIVYWNQDLLMNKCKLLQRINIPIKCKAQQPKKQKHQLIILSVLRTLVLCSSVVYLFYSL